MARKRRRAMELDGLNLMPIMDMMVILIPAVLMMVVFTNIGVIDISPPKLASKSKSDKPLDQDKTQLDAAVAAGAPVVELHTGAYADAAEADHGAELQRIVDATEYGHSLGLIINAGHGLHYSNVQAIAVIPQIVELNIGHAIISRAVFDGLMIAVGDMKRLMMEARSA